MGKIPAPWTAVRTTPNRSVRQNVPRKGVCLHHAAMTSLSGLRSLAMGAKQVSATAIVKDGEAENLVRDGDRPWSLADAWGDSAFRSVETANESTNGWTISDASHWTLARLVAYWAEQDGFWPHRSGDPRTWTVIGHREFHTIYGGSYATACPGGMDLDLVTRRAQQLLGGTSAAGGKVTPISEEETMTVLTVDYGTSKPYPGKHVFRIGEEALRYLPQAADVAANRKLDSSVDVSAVEFTRLCAARGIPIGQNGEPNVPIILLTNGKTGKGLTFWSRARDVNDLLSRVAKKLGA